MSRPIKTGVFACEQLYTCPPATNVVPIKTDLLWEEFTVIPESYATAWTCLHRNLEIKKGQTLVIRGATSALGRAAINIAADAGTHIIATTRKKERFDRLLELGAHRAEIETPKLSQSIAERKQIDAVLDLVGNTTFMDSLSMLRRGGRMCLAGFLGGLDPVNNFNPLLQIPSGVYFTFLAALCSALLIFQSQIFLFNRSWIKWPQGFTKQSRLESFNLTRFARRTRRWNRTRPMAKWWSASEGV